MLRINIFCFTTLLCCISNLYTQSVFDNILNPGRLPYLKKSKLVQISSFDSTGGNNDRINIHSGKTATILDMEGTGYDYADLDHHRFQGSPLPAEDYFTDVLGW